MTTMNTAIMDTITSMKKICITQRLLTVSMTSISMAGTTHSTLNRLLTLSRILTSLSTLGYTSQYIAIAVSIQPILKS